MHCQYLNPEHVTKYYIKPVRRKEHIFWVFKNMVLGEYLNLRREEQEADEKWIMIDLIIYTSREILLG